MDRGAVLELDHPGDRGLSLNPARFATCVEPSDSDHSLANVANLRVVEANLGESLLLVSEPLANPSCPR